MNRDWLQLGVRGLAVWAAVVAGSAGGVLGAADDQPSEAASAEALRRQIESSPGDDRAAMWMLDLAAIELARVMRTCDEASVLFGVATEAQQREVAAAAERARVLVEQAAAAATAAVERLEARLIESGQTPEQARATAAEIEPILNRLVDVELGARVPAMRMECAALAAALASGAEGEQKRVAALKLASEGRPVGLAAETRSRLLTAAVLVRMPGPQHAEAARRQLQWFVGKLEGGDAGLDAAATVRVHMAMIRCGLADQSAKLACPGRGKDWLVDLLLAEAAAAAMVQSVAPTPAQVELALRGLVDVARKYGEREELDSTGELGALRQLAYQKIARCTGPGTAWSRLDAEVALARAWTLSVGSSNTDAESAALLAEVAGRVDAAAGVRARAMWMLGSGESGLRWVVRLVRELPETRLALAAAERVAVDESADRVDVLAALRLLVRAHAGDAAVVGRLVGLLLDPVRTPSADDLNEAMAAVRGLGDAAAVGEPIRSAVSAAAERLAGAPGDSAARDAALRAAAGWFAWLGEDSRARADELRLERVELALAAGLEPASASLADLRALTGTALDAPGSVSRARLRAALGIAQRRNGQVQAALATLRSVAEGYEADARTSDAARRSARAAFWSAWAEMLEMVVSGELGSGGAGESGGSAAERVQQASRHRERLELIDPELGGEPWAGRIRAAGGAGAR